SGIATPPGGTFSVLLRVLRANATTLLMDPAAPDAAPTYAVNTTQGQGAWTTAQPATPSPTSATDAATFWANWTVPSNWSVSQPAVLVARANLQGATLTTACPLTIADQGGADPLSISASYSWDTHRASIAVHANFGNGTARSGQAGQIIVRLYAPDATQNATSVTLTEGAASGTYFATPYLGTSPTLGARRATAELSQPTGQGLVTAATTFTITDNLTLRFLDARDLQLDLW